MIVLGMAALGLLVGIFAAWSATPIVTTLLPLLFGIVGGASGFSVARMDIASEKGKLKLNLVGGMLGAFSVACIVALLAGVYFRPAVQRIDQVTLQYGATAPDYVDGVILKRMLQVLGATPTETEYLFELVGKDSNKDAISETIKKIDEAIKRTPVLAPNAPPNQKQAEEDDTWRFPLAYDRRDWSTDGRLLWVPNDVLIAPDTKGGG